MASPTTQVLLPLAAILCLILLHSTPADSSNNTPTAYEVLKSYNFPVGLLPKGVKGYDLNITTGEFSAYFNGSCSFSQGSYKLKYNSIIKGYISDGKLASLEGISVKLFFMWSDIGEIRRTGDNLDFTVGIASTRFPIDYFEESPQCGCGLSCSSRRVWKLRTNTFASSYYEGSGGFDFV